LQVASQGNTEKNKNLIAEALNRILFSPVNPVYPVVNYLFELLRVPGELCGKNNASMATTL
jgi:hypothetical protein